MPGRWRQVHGRKENHCRYGTHYNSAKVLQYKWYNIVNTSSFFTFIHLNYIYIFVDVIVKHKTRSLLNIFPGNEVEDYLEGTISMDNINQCTNFNGTINSYDDLLLMQIKALVNYFVAVGRRGIELYQDQHQTDENFDQIQ